MGLDEEYQRAREWINSELTFEVDDKHHAFEVSAPTSVSGIPAASCVILNALTSLPPAYPQTTIRVLGGLLAAYHLSNNDKLYLEKAVDLADRILPIFDTVSGHKSTDACG